MKRRGDGFSLIETLVALSLLLIGLSALARLFVLASNAQRHARSMSAAVMLADQKMEQLEGLLWSYDLSSNPVFDATTDTTTAPPSSSGGTGLSLSPPDALTTRVLGYCDFADERGRSVACDHAPSPGAWYERHWSIDPLEVDPDTIVVQIWVAPLGSLFAAGPRAPGEARLVALKTRRGGI